jgi:hypothetical protein
VSAGGGRQWTVEVGESGLGETGLTANDPTADSEQLYVELWVSLASLLRSYTAAHGLNGKLQATVELGEEEILVRHGDNWLALERNGAHVQWSRENGNSGVVAFTEFGTLRPADPRSPNARDLGHPDLGTGAGAGEEEMDMAAERWARELMMGERQQ